MCVYVCVCPRLQDKMWEVAWDELHVAVHRHLHTITSSQDEQLARQLMEEEQRQLEQLRRVASGDKVDQDHELAIQLQQEQLVSIKKN